MRLLPLVTRLATDRRGNFAIISALAMVPLLLSLGGAVDFAILEGDKKAVQNALDAAALAAAKYYPIDKTDAGLARVAQAYFDANTHSLVRTTASMTFKGTAMTTSGDRQVRLSSCFTYEPVFLKLAPVAFTGLSGSTCAEANSIVTVSLTSVEVAMVLDTSGSMNSAPAAGGSTKISTLKSVAANAVETLFGGSTSTGGVDPVKMAVVPFSGGVNVGASSLDAWWMDPKGQSSIHHENFDWSTYKNPATGLPDAVQSALYPGAWTMISSPTTFLTRQHVLKKLGAARSEWGFKGCVESRPAPFGITDTAPDPSKPDSLFVPYFAPDEADNLTKCQRRSKTRPVGRRKSRPRWREGRDTGKGPIGPFPVSRRRSSDQGSAISPVSGSTASALAWFCSAPAATRRRPVDCFRR